MTVEQFASHLVDVIDRCELALDKYAERADDRCGLKRIMGLYEDWYWHYKNHELASPVNSAKAEILEAVLRELRKFNERERVKIMKCRDCKWLNTEKKTKVGCLCENPYIHHARIGHLKYPSTPACKNGFTMKDGDESE